MVYRQKESVKCVELTVDELVKEFSWKELALAIDWSGGSVSPSSMKEEDIIDYVEDYLISNSKRDLVKLVLDYKDGDYTSFVENGCVFIIELYD